MPIKIKYSLKPVNERPLPTLTIDEILKMWGQSQPNSSNSWLIGGNGSMVTTGSTGTTITFDSNNSNWSWSIPVHLTHPTIIDTDTNAKTKL